MDAVTVDSGWSGRWLGRVLASLPIILAAGAGVAAWAVFRPGFMDSDTCDHVNQAVSGKYHDWFSPLVPLAVHWALKAGGGLSTATLFQAVFVAVGVYQMALELLQLLTSNRRPVWQTRWAALAVLAVLLTPFSPLVYYLCHYKNDSLMAGFLTWAVAGWLCVDRVWNRDPQPGSRVRELAALLSAIGCTIGAIVIRYNAVVVLPVFLLLVALVLGRASRITAAVAACAILIGPVAVHRGLLRLTGAEERHPERQLMALELVGMCVERDDLRSRLPYTSGFLIEGRYRTRYAPGVVTPVMDWGPEPDRIVRRGYVWDDYMRLAREYRRAIRIAPWTWLMVKAKAAAASLLDPIPWWHRREIAPNPYGLHFRSEFRSLRSLLLDIDTAIWQDPVLRFLCARHLPWVVLDLALLALAGVAAWMSRTRRAAWIAILLLLALAYYASHLVAVTVHDYRFMYPATLMMQILVACGLIRYGWRRLRSYVRAVEEPGLAPAPLSHGRRCRPTVVRPKTGQVHNERTSPEGDAPY